MQLTTFSATHTSYTGPKICIVTAGRIERIFSFCNVRIMRICDCSHSLFLLVISMSLLHDLPSQTRVKSYTHVFETLALLSAYLWPLHCMLM